MGRETNIVPTVYRPREEDDSESTIRVGSQVSQMKGPVEREEVQYKNSNKISEKSKSEAKRVSKKEEFKKTKVFIGNRVRVCQLVQIRRRQWYESARNCAEEDMLMLYPRKKEKREDAEEMSKKARKCRMSMTRLFEEAWKQVVRENFVSGGVNQALKEL